MQRLPSGSSLAGSSFHAGGMKKSELNRLRDICINDITGLQRQQRVANPSFPPDIVSCPLRRWDGRASRPHRVRASLQAFDEDWDAPGMEEYDRL